MPPSAGYTIIRCHLDAVLISPNSTQTCCRKSLAIVCTLISGLKEHGKLLLVVDQPTTIGALPVTVARSEGILVAYLPGLAMRRIADLHAGEAKTDARDAAIIAEAARSMPHALRSLRLSKSTGPEVRPVHGMDNLLARIRNYQPSRRNRQEIG